MYRGRLHEGLTAGGRQPKAPHSHRAMRCVHIKCDYPLGWLVAHLFQAIMNQYSWELAKWVWKMKEPPGAAHPGHREASRSSLRRLQAEGRLQQTSCAQIVNFLHGRGGLTSHLLPKHENICHFLCRLLSPE